MSDLTTDSGGRIGPESLRSVCLGAPEPSWALRDTQGRAEGSERRGGQREVTGRPTGGSWAPLSGHVRPPEATNAAPVSPSGSEAATEAPASGHTCGTPPSMACCACIDELAPADDPFDVGPIEPEYLATARPGDTVILRTPGAEYEEALAVTLKGLVDLNPAVTFVVLSPDSDATVVSGDLGSAVVEIARLRALLAEALPIIEYVSAGRRFVGAEPYPDAAARRVNAQIREELEDAA